MAELTGRVPVRPAAGMHARAEEAESQGRWSDAVAALEHLARVQPKVAQHRVRLAHALEKAGRPRAAVETWRRVAESFAKDGFREKAIACLIMARTICRHDERVDELLTKLRAERKHALAAEQQRQAAEDDAALLSDEARRAEADAAAMAPEATGKRPSFDELLERASVGAASR